MNADRIVKQLSAEFDEEWEVLFAAMYIAIRANGWVNASGWCRKFGKKFKDFKASWQYKDYCKLYGGKNGFGDVSCQKQGKEYFIHPDLATLFAGWLSPEVDKYVMTRQNDKEEFTNRLNKIDNFVKSISF